MFSALVQVSPYKKARAFLFNYSIRTVVLFGAAQVKAKHFLRRIKSATPTCSVMGQIATACPP